MGIIAGFLGCIFIAYAVVDLLWTAFLEGGAPVTTRASRLVERLLLRSHCRRESRRFMPVAGLLAVVTTVVIWTAMIWAGWALLFSASPGALVSSATGRPASEWDRVYFAGYTIFTLGLGDFRPVGPVWEMLTAVAAGSGFLLIGTAVAYLVPVISAATQKRQTAVCISSLGRSPSDIIIRAWNGVDTTALGPHLVSLTAMLALLGESHLTYPVLHYFHSSKRSSAIGPSVAALDEAITILECGLQQGCSLDLPSLGAARQAITEFLQTLAPALIFAAEAGPATPSLGWLRQVGVPVVDDALFEAAVAGVAERRKLLLALVQHEGWSWDAVWPAKEGVPATNAGAAIHRA